MDRKEFAIRGRAAGCRRFCGCWSTCKANLKKSDDEETGEGAVETLLSLFLNITKPEEFIKAFVAATIAAEKVPA